MLAKKRKKEKKVIQREKFTKLVFISLLTAVIIQKGKLLPAYVLIQDLLCNNCNVGSVILQPLKSMGSALSTEGEAGSDPKTEMMSLESSLQTPSSTRRSAVAIE